MPRHYADSETFRVGGVNRRILTLLAALVPVSVLGVLGTVFTVPFVALGPGPTFDTLGEYDGVPVVEVEGAELDETTGHLNMTTVSVRDGLNLYEAFGFWASGKHGLVPRAEVYPPGVPRDEIDQSNQQEFRNSESAAEVAAMNYLKLPTAVLVRDIGESSPARGVLEPGDEIVSVGGVPANTPGDVVRETTSRAPGTPLTVVYRRDGVERTSEFVLGTNPEDATKAALGVTIGTGARPPIEVSFNLADIGGPSAGLMFSLALIDKLSPGELGGGDFVAGTGTIETDGKVGPIGGIQYKMIAASEAGAETFLVPAANCTEAQQRVPDGLRLVKVETLDGAVRSLSAINAGEEAPSCG